MMVSTNGRGLEHAFPVPETRSKLSLALSIEVKPVPERMLQHDAQIECKPLVRRDWRELSSDLFTKTN